MKPARADIVLGFVRRLFGGGDALASHREQILYRIAVVGAVLLTPFAINNFIQGRYPLGIALVVTVLVLVLDAAAIWRKRKAPVPFALLLVPGAAAMALSLVTQGIYGALWSYPVVLFCYFALTRRMAVAVSLAMLAGTTLLVQLYIDFEMAVRVFVSLLLTIVIVNIIIGVVSDLHGKLLAQTITDPLTGAFNRRHMETCLDEAIERQRRNGTPAALLLIDIDHFKGVNDHFGHAAGDSVLRTVVALIADRVRRLDRLFRIGGEEFLLLLPDTDAAAALSVAEELRGLIAAASMPGAPRVTVSIGVAALDAGQSMDGWMQEADTALYQAKQQGRDRVVPAGEQEAAAEA